MNIILMTVLLTLLGAGLVILLVWLGVVSWKGIRYRKNNDADVTSLGQRIDENYNHFEKEIEDLKDDVISPSVHELYQSIDKSKTDAEEHLMHLTQYIEEYIKEQDRKLDSRFDKIQQSIKDIKTDIFNIQQTKK